MKIAILGCGYIGTHLARLWNEQKQSITAVVNTPTKLTVLNEITEQTILLKNGNKNQIKPILKQNDTIILSASSDKQSRYEEHLLNDTILLKESAQNINKDKHVIFLGRASIYAEQNGRWVDEDTKIEPTNDTEKQLYEAEQSIMSLKELGWTVSILRIAELYGPGYEISKKIKNNSDYFLNEFSDKYTNMIHLDDVIGAINFILINKLEGIYNLADDDHQTLEDLINAANRKLHIKPEKYNDLENKKQSNFRVSNHKIKSSGYSFIHPNRVLS